MKPLPTSPIPSVSASDQWQHHQRVALIVQYVGTHFHGWQWQARERTVQGEIEAAIASALGHPVSIHGAGRTDAGVHAAAQVAHFNAPVMIPAHRWADILGSRLPADILIRASAPVPQDWHAQFSAQWRRYRYTIYTDPCPNLFLSPYVWHYYYEPIDIERIRNALAPLVGYHDLAAFHRSRSGRSHSWVEIQAVDCQRRGSLITVEIQANGFLYGMIRLMMGLLVQVGTGQVSVETFTGLWKERRRDLVKYSAPAKGLCLLRVGYEIFPFAPEVWFDAQPQFHLSMPAFSMAG